MKKFVWYWLGLLLSLGCIALAQAPVKKAPTTISIADKAKYEVTQLKISAAIKDLQNAQLQTRIQQDQETIAQQNLNKAVQDALADVGVPSSEATSWVYDPPTFTFTKRQAPPQAVLENKK